MHVLVINCGSSSLKFDVINIDSQEELSKKWTEEEIQKALKREGKDANGAPLDEDDIDLSGDGR